MNDFGPKLKVGGVNITARYKCGYKRLVGCARRVSRMAFTRRSDLFSVDCYVVSGVYHPLTSCLLYSREVVQTPFVA